MNKRSTTIVYGRKFNTYLLPTVEETNKFLERNPKYGVLASDDNGIHVAKLDDKGEKVDGPE